MIGVLLFVPAGHKLIIIIRITSCKVRVGYHHIIIIIIIIIIIRTLNYSIESNALLCVVRHRCFIRHRGTIIGCSTRYCILCPISSHPHTLPSSAGAVAITYTIIMYNYNNILYVV